MCQVKIENCNNTAEGELAIADGIIWKQKISKPE